MILCAAPNEVVYNFRSDICRSGSVVRVEVSFSLGWTEI